VAHEPLKQMAVMILLPPFFWIVKFFWVVKGYELSTPNSKLKTNELPLRLNFIVE
jgi:hypothetical protein